MKKFFLKYGILCMAFLGFSVQASAQTLEDYLLLAAENNPQVKAAYTQFEAALQNSPQVSSLPNPNLTIGAFGKMMQTDMGAEEAKISLMQSFPWFGTLRAKEEAANLMAEAKFQEYLEIRNQVFYEVKSAYAELFLVNRNIELEEDNLEILEAYKELALSQVRSGRTPMVNVVKINMEQNAAETGIALLQDQLLPLKADFNLLLNRSLEEEVAIQDTLVFSFSGELIPQDSLWKHPSLQRLQKQKESYEKQKEVAWKEGMPVLGLGVDYTINSKSAMGMPAMNGEDMYMPMLSISLPIFRKKYKAASEEAEFLKEATEQQQQTELNVLLGDYERTKYELNKAKRLLDLYEQQIKSSNQAKELMLSALGNGTGNLEDVLEMNQSILLLKAQQLETLKNGFMAQAKMEYLLSKKFVNENEE